MQIEIWIFLKLCHILKLIKVISVLMFDVATKLKENYTLIRNANYTLTE